MSAQHEAPSETTRRRLLRRAGAWLLVGAPLSGGTLWSALCLRSAWSRPAPPARMFVREVSRTGIGRSLVVRTPAGSPIAVTRTGSGSSVEDFVALSNVCPHLGCRVRWNAAQQRYDCPCHHASFDAMGAPLAGPPLASGQRLRQYTLEVDRGLLFVLLPPAELGRSRRAGGGAT